MNQTAYENMNSQSVDTSNILTQAAAYTVNDGGTETPVDIVENHNNQTTKNFQSSFDKYFLGGAHSSNKHLKTLKSQIGSKKKLSPR